MKKYTFNELASVLIEMWYKYEEVPDFVKETAEYLQMCELEAINYSLTNGSSYDKM